MIYGLMIGLPVLLLCILAYKLSQAKFKTITLSDGTTKVVEDLDYHYKSSELYIPTDIKWDLNPLYVKGKTDY
jgi:hypothetical protein